jgi:hypothetical protein
MRTITKLAASSVFVYSRKTLGTNKVFLRNIKLDNFKNAHIFPRCDINTRQIQNLNKLLELKYYRSLSFLIYFN